MSPRTVVTIWRSFHVSQASQEPVRFPLNDTCLPHAPKNRSKEHAQPKGENKGITFKHAQLVHTAPGCDRKRVCRIRRDPAKQCHPIPEVRASSRHSRARETEAASECSLGCPLRSPPRQHTRGFGQILKKKIEAIRPPP